VTPLLAAVALFGVASGALWLVMVRPAPHRAAPREGVTLAQAAANEGELAPREGKGVGTARPTGWLEAEVGSESDADAGAADSEHDEDLARLYAPTDPAHENLDDTEPSEADVRLQEERRAMRERMLRAGMRPEDAVHAKRD
jgi:hypothetical protein